MVPINAVSLVIPGVVFLALTSISGGCRRAEVPSTNDAGMEHKEPRLDIHVSFDPAKPTPLCTLLESLGSDKGRVRLPWHNYTRFYYPLFLPVQNKALRIFEMGIGSSDPSIPSNMNFMPGGGSPGASLRAWKAFFPRAMVFGADIDKKALFKEERIETFFCDMTKPEIIQAMWREPALSGDMDIIIDDGLHVFEAQVTFAENSFDKLAKGGIHIIEDALTDDLPRWVRKTAEWKARLPLYSFRIIPIFSPRNLGDNNLVVIQRNSGG